MNAKTWTEQDGTFIVRVTDGDQVFENRMPPFDMVAFWDEVAVDFEQSTRRPGPTGAEHRAAAAAKVARRKAKGKQ